jgi:small ligand-binding sensory domain FIST
MPTSPANRAVSCLLAPAGDEDSVRRAVGECRERLGANPDLVLVFASSDHRRSLPGIIETLRLDGRAAKVVGASAEGLFGVGREWENASGLSLLFLSLPNTPIEILTSRRDLETSRLLDTAPAGFCLLADPIRGGLQGPLRDFNTLFPGIPVIGGMISGGPSEEDLFLFDDRGPLAADFVAIGLGANVRIEPLVAQGCRPIGEPLVITKSRGKVVHSIAGKKPYEVLEETFSSLDEALRHSAEGNIFAGLAVREEVEDFATGDFVIRHIVGTDLSEGRLVLDAQARVGQTLQFQLREASVAKETLTRQAETIVAAHGRPFAALVCAGRGRGRQLHGSPGEDATILEGIIGPAPLAGFFGNGELGPVAGVNFRHDHSLCGALFYEA